MNNKIKKLIKRFACFGMVFILIAISTGFTVFADGAYTYNHKNEVVSCPAPVVTNSTHFSKINGIDTPLNTPSDLAVYKDRIYIADTGNNRIVITDLQLNYITEISEFTLNGNQTSFATPTGVFVSGDGLIYVADTDNCRVVIFDLSLNAIREVKDPKGSILEENFVFRPKKVTADVDGRMFVIAYDIYNGLMQFDINGDFLGFTGVNPVKYSVIDLLWKKILSDKQKESMDRYIPTEFDGLTIDNKGFVYTVTASVDTWSPSSSYPIKKHTGNGSNILKFPSEVGTPIGDLDYPYTTDSEEIKGPSNFVDIAVGDGGIYCALDSKRNRVFTYDASGYLLFVFGGTGKTEATFQKPVAIDISNGHIYILDGETGDIFDFVWSEFGKNVLAAEEYFYTGDFKASKAAWENVLKIDSRYEIAYNGLGRAQVQLGEYDEAMENFKIAHNKENYSKSLTRKQRQIIEENFVWLVGGVLLVIALIAVYCLKLMPKVHAKLSKYEVARGIFFGGHVIRHPFDGFWDMKREKRGNMISAFVFYALFVITMVLQDGAMGFMFKASTHEFHLLLSAAKGVLICVLWWIASYCITTLLDGDGSISDIIMAGGYAVIPYVLLGIPSVILSNVLTIDGAVIITVISSFAVIWSVFLVFVSMTQIHQYTALKAFATMALSVIAMAIIVFLGLLLFNIIQQLCSFVLSIYNEIVFRV